MNIVDLRGVAPAPHELLKKFNQNFYLPAAQKKRDHIWIY